LPIPGAAQFLIDAGRRGGGNLRQSVSAVSRYFRPSTPTPQPYKPVPRHLWHKARFLVMEWDFYGTSHHEFFLLNAMGVVMSSST
ncbi:hypothetical protein, partial [Hydrogenophaga sp.]|uniref:hypothetical protein n=1 Tax=Hydrogenophaga sp. TaxID=1904254 RepID=UPI00271F6A22